MLGVLVNTGAIIAGGLLGQLLKRGIPQKYNDAIMQGLGLCILYIGISGALDGTNALVPILAISLGALIGTALDLQGKLDRLGEALQKRIVNTDNSDESPSFSRGFVTACLLFCVGAMAVVGPLNSGISGDNSMLYTKSVLDFISSIVLGASLGIGVAFSSIAIFLFEGAIALLSSLLAPIMTETVIAEINCTGSILIMGLAFNSIGITKIKVMNYILSIFIAALIAALFL